MLCHLCIHFQNLPTDSLYQDIFNVLNIYWYIFCDYTMFVEQLIYYLPGHQTGSFSTYNWAFYIPVVKGFFWLNSIVWAYPQSLNIFITFFICIYYIHIISLNKHLLKTCCVLSFGAGKHKMTKIISQVLPRGIISVWDVIFYPQDWFHHQFALVLLFWEYAIIMLVHRV